MPSAEGGDRGAAIWQAPLPEYSGYQHCGFDCASQAEVDKLAEAEAAKGAKYAQRLQVSAHCKRIHVQAHVTFCTRALMMKPLCM